MSNAIKIQKDKPKPNTSKISQSIPANFYKNYVPPKTPKINPMKPPAAIPALEELPKNSSSENVTNMKQNAQPRSLSNRYPMSMPVHGLMGPNFRAYTAFKPLSTQKEEPSESKDEPNSLERKTKELKVGSFTCFDVMNSPLQQLTENPDAKDTASATSGQTQSTFNSGGDFEEQAPEQNDDDDEDLPFAME